MIRALWILLVVAAVLMLWRSHRRNRQLPDRSDSPEASLSGQPKAMVRCAVCGVHLPQADAVVTPAGAYCSDAHCRQAAAR